MEETKERIIRAAIRGLWLPYFRFWVSHPDETVFYHRFRDSAFFPSYDRSRDVSYFDRFSKMVRLCKETFPGLGRLNQDLLWLHVLTATVMYAKYVVEGVLPNNEETEDAAFRLMVTGLSGCLAVWHREGGGLRIAQGVCFAVEKIKIYSQKSADV